MAKLKFLGVVAHGETRYHQYMVVNDDGSEITRADGTAPVFNGPGVDLTGACRCKFEGTAEEREAHLKERCNMEAFHRAEQLEILDRWHRAEAEEAYNHQSALAALEQVNSGHPIVAKGGQ